VKYIFIVQGEGRGHLMQALALRDLLVKNGHEVLEVLVGKSPHRQIPGFFNQKIQCPLKTFDSPNFLPAQNDNKVVLLKSVIYNTKRSPEFVQSLKLLHERIKTLKPDVVVNFYDFIAGLLFEIRRPKARFVCIAHQYLFLHPDFSFSKLKLHPELPSLLFYTKLTCLRADKILALSFGTHPDYDAAGIYIVPPLLREEILDAEPVEGDYILGYMLNPTFQQQVMNWHQENKTHKLEFFWDKADAEESTTIDETFTLHTINDTKFIDYMKRCRAYASTSGFESVCEALYLQKPVLMVPAHIEQSCNAVDAERAGAGISSDTFDLTKLIEFIPQYKPNKNFRKWAKSAELFFIHHLTNF